MTEHEFQRIVKYIAVRYGINLDKKRILVSGRLDNYLSMHGYESYDAYMNVVESDITGNEAQNLVNILTTNHTYFMREPEHFTFFKEVILPQIEQSERVTKDLRIWSAASSSGEEPYTIAMYIKDYFGLNYPQWETSILATDISKRVLETAVHGVYAAEQVAPLPENWKRSNFIRLNEHEYQVRKELRDKVIFRQFNLMNPIPFKHKLQVVFLRNVMIYFDDDTKRALVQRIYDVLEPGGYLIIGSTESIDKTATDFHFVRPSIFQK